MNRQELYNFFVRAKRPIDCFGDIKDEKELKKVYFDFVKQIHPDTAKKNEKYVSNEGFVLLQYLYKKAQEELEKGIYALRNPVDIYNAQTPLFELNIHKKDYKFYELLNEGEIADIYKGVCDKDLVVLKLCLEETDNHLLEQEYSTLKKYTHSSFPIVRDFIKINGRTGIVMDEISGVPLEDVMKKRKNGIEPLYVAWILERMFSAIGYLHSNYIVHGNLNPDNIILNGIIHNVGITGFSFHIPEANEGKNKYQIKNEDFSAPEVSKDMKVLPSSDIYSIGKLAIYMLGGNVKNNGMPINIDSRMREFIRKLVEKDYKKRSDDAWKLWDEWRELRVKIFGKPHYIPIEF